MPSDSLTFLDTSEVASGFNDFLVAQGLGEMNPSSAARFKNGVLISPMDEILALNGYSLDELFAKKLPEPPPLNAVNTNLSGQDSDNISASERDSISNAKIALNSLGLSEEELKTVSELILFGANLSPGSLPIEMQSLLQKEGINSMQDLLLQLGELYKLVGDRQLPKSSNLMKLMLEWMSDLNTKDTTYLLNYLRNNPLTLSDALRDPLTGIIHGLGGSSAVIRARNAFAIDPIIGTSASDTIVGNQAGNSRLIGGGGPDFFVIPLRNKPFTAPTTIVDYDGLSGSKIVLDAVYYNSPIGRVFKVARSKRLLRKICESRAALIYSNSDGRLMINGNGRKPGLGIKNGGVIAILENNAILDAGDLLVLRDYGSNNLMHLNGTAFLG